MIVTIPNKKRNGKGRHGCSRVGEKVSCRYEGGIKTGTTGRVRSARDLSWAVCGERRKEEGVREQGQEAIKRTGVAVRLNYIGKGSWVGEFRVGGGVRQP